MDKDILRQYTDLQEEIADLRERIDRKERLIAQMEEAGYSVKDSVKGSKAYGIIGAIPVEGFPGQEYDYQKSLLYSSRLRMELKLDELLHLTNEVEKFIDEIEDSRMRRLFRYRYLDNMTWIQISHLMGSRMTAESCRKQHDRFLEKN